jgi:hypothetical protein
VKVKESNTGLYAVHDVEEELADLHAKMARLVEWTHQMGASLHPPGPDSYGEGMRDAKQQVFNIITANLPSYHQALMDLAAAREKEACAKTCEELGRQLLNGTAFATAIRARR